MSDVLKRQFDQCALLAKGAPFLKGAPSHEILDFCHNHGRTFMEHKFAMVPKLEFAKDGFTMASDAGWSREHFSRQFKLQYGLAPKKAELAARVNAARAMLRIGEHPANVAYDLGYADQSHLTRHFQYFFGIAPGAYIRGLKFKA